MFGLRFGRKRERIVLVLDIESGSAAAAVVVLQEKRPALVLVSERTRIPVEKRDAAQNGARVVDVLGESLEKTMKQYQSGELAKVHGPVGEVSVIVGGPWVRSRTARAEEVFQKDRAVTDADIKRLAKQALAQPSQLEPSRVFETNVIRVQLNGYATGKPVGKVAKRFSVTVFQSDVESNLKSGIEQKVGAALPGRTITFKSRTRALVTALHERAGDVHDFFIVSVEDAITACTVVRKEEVVEHAIVAEGIATLTNRFGGKEALPEELPTILRMIASDTCSAPECERAKEAIARAEPELVTVFGKTFGTLATSRRIPNHCVILVENEYAPWSEAFFSRIDFSQFTLTTQPFITETLTAEHLRPFVTFASNTHEDAGVALAAGFVHIHDTSAI